MLVLLVVAATPAHAGKLVRAHTFADTDWVSAGVGGVGEGSGSIAITGVTGTVTKALLYWDGIATLPSDGEYDNDVVAIDAHPVTGVPIGDSSTNCWGNASSRAFVADVTDYVTGNGSYGISGLNADPTHQANGASLIVLFNDGNPANDVDLLIFEGNDSNITGGAEEDNGWHEYLDNIEYTHGTVRAQVHVADGQNFDDDTVRFLTTLGYIDVHDSVGIYDGASVPSAGSSRAAEGNLWDIHTFDITPAFPQAGVFGLNIDGAARVEDCIALVVLVLEFGATSSPNGCGDGTLKAPEQCDDGNTLDGDCCSSTCRFEPAGSVCGTPGDVCLEALCDGAGTCDTEGRGCRTPVVPRGAELTIRNMPHDWKDLIAWRWGTGVSSVADFGNPLETTSYDLCIYDKGTGNVRLLSHVNIPPGGTCNGVPCWQPTTSGYTYSNPTGRLHELVLQGGLPGTAKIVAKSEGPAMVPPLPVSPTVMVRLRSSDGGCWRAHYTLPERNGRRRFKGRSDYYHP